MLCIGKWGNFDVPHSSMIKGWLCINLYGNDITFLKLCSEFIYSYNFTWKILKVI